MSGEAASAEEPGREVNWRRGLYRIWALGSATWIGILIVLQIWAFTISPDQKIALRDLLTLAVWAVVGPALALAIWHAVIWIVDGFRTPRAPG